MENITAYDIASLSISLAALMFSSFSLWLLHFRRGDLFLTRPSQICIGPNVSLGGNYRLSFTTNLYSNSKNGPVVERLFAEIRLGETTRKLTVWYTETDREKACPGFRLEERGLATEHHFCDKNKDTWPVAPGRYFVSLFAKVGHNSGPTKLFECSLNIEPRATEYLANDKTPISFLWDENDRCYFEVREFT